MLVKELFFLQAFSKPLEKKLLSRHLQLLQFTLSLQKRSKTSLKLEYLTQKVENFLLRVTFSSAKLFEIRNWNAFEIQSLIFNNNNSVLGMHSTPFPGHMNLDQSFSLFTRRALLSMQTAVSRNVHVWFHLVFTLLLFIRDFQLSFCSQVSVTCSKNKQKFFWLKGKPQKDRKSKKILIGWLTPWFLTKHPMCHFEDSSFALSLSRGRRPLVNVSAK